MLNTLIYAEDDRKVRELWSAGRHRVTAGLRIHRDTIVQAQYNCRARVTPANDSESVLRKRVHAMFMTGNKEVAGDDPELQSVSWRGAWTSV